MSFDLPAAGESAGEVRAGEVVNEPIPPADELAGLQSAVRALETQFSRMGKEYFRANVLAESRQKSLEQLLEQQAQTEQRRERELGDLRERLVGEKAAGQREVIEALLPVIDGLEDAVAFGTRLLPEGAAPSPPPSFGERWRAAMAALSGGAGDSSPALAGESAQAVRAWLEGVRLVLERAKVVLADAGVHPIPCEGAPFDPHLHVAVEAEPAPPGIAPGTVVREVRRGYRQGKVVLRFAEVVVARQMDPTP